MAAEIVSTSDFPQSAIDAAGVGIPDMDAASQLAEEALNGYHGDLDIIWFTVICAVVMFLIVTLGYMVWAKYNRMHLRNTNIVEVMMFTGLACVIPGCLIFGLIGMMVSDATWNRDQALQENIESITFSDTQEQTKMFPIYAFSDGTFLKVSISPDTGELSYAVSVDGEENGYHVEYAIPVAETEVVFDKDKVNEQTIDVISFFQRADVSKLPCGYLTEEDANGRKVNAKEKIVLTDNKYVIHLMKSEEENAKHIVNSAQTVSDKFIDMSVDAEIETRNRQQNNK